MAGSVALCRVVTRCGYVSVQSGLVGRFGPPFILSTVMTQARSAAGPVVIQRCLRGTRAASSSSSSSTATDNNNSNGVEKKIQQNLERIRDRQFEDEIKDPEELKHFRQDTAHPRARHQTQTGKHDINRPLGPVTEEPPVGTSALPHPIWSEEELHSVRVTHKKPERMVDKMAYLAVRTLRGGYDLVSGYNRNVRDEKLWINRLCFLETIAGVPGMVAAMVRHLDSLRKMRRDHGWIHTLLEEAENERMHLMTVLQLKQPSLLFRVIVMLAQGVFVSMFSVAYMLSPRFCHRLVGYLEEEAVMTYSKLLKDMESGAMTHWNTKAAPDIAVRYWALRPNATMKDVILAIRADEAHHRVVNHTLGSMKPDDYNPYKPGK